MYTVFSIKLQGKLSLRDRAEVYNENKKHTTFHVTCLCSAATTNASIFQEIICKKIYNFFVCWNSACMNRSR